MILAIIVIKASLYIKSAFKKLKIINSLIQTFTISQFDVLFSYEQNSSHHGMVDIIHSCNFILPQQLTKLQNFSRASSSTSTIKNEKF